MSNSSRDYLKPKVDSPKFLRDNNQRNGQFINPPLYMQFGGMGSSRKLHRDGLGNNMSLERGGPSARKGKPI